MPTLGPPQADTLEGLDALSYLEKLRHWLRPDCWAPGGNQIRFKNPKVSRSSVRIDGGNISRMPILVGKPCFGIATAYLQYRYRTKFVKNRGALPVGRCHRCNAQEACHFVVDRRLRYQPEIESAWVEWLQYDGPNAFGRPGFKNSHVAKLWSKLYFALSRFPYTSSNDENVKNAYLEAEQQRREQDRLRHARSRLAARASGELDAADEAALDAASKKRRFGLTLAFLHPDAPKELARLPEQSIDDLMDAWLGRETLTLKKMKANAPSIARWIVETGRRNTSKNHAALSSRVSKDLARLSELEQLPWGSGHLIAPLDTDRELPDLTRNDGNPVTNG